MSTRYRLNVCDNCGKSVENHFYAHGWIQISDPEDSLSIEIIKTPQSPDQPRMFFQQGGVWDFCSSTCLKEWADKKLAESP